MAAGVPADTAASCTGPAPPPRLRRLSPALRWHRTETGDALLACFVHVPDDPAAPARFVVWTPDGHDTASPGAIGRHVNRGLDQAAHVYPAHTFRAAFRTPDVVARALDEV